MIKDIEQNFIYELQNIIIYGNSNYSGTAKYFSEYALEHFIYEATTCVTNDTKYIPIMPETEPTYQAILLKSVIIALKNVINDINNKIEKVKMLLCEEQEESKYIISFSSLVHDCENLYEETIKQIKKD